MDILAYTYIAAYHCIDCTRVEFAATFYKWGVESSNLDLDENDIPIDQKDEWSDYVRPVFDFDSWMELGERYIEENPRQYLECEDCHRILDTYPRILYGPLAVPLYRKQTERTGDRR